jgi:hypothetical protein
MTENQIATSELDLDAWLAGGSRNTQIVELYARNDLHAEILSLEAKLLPEKDTSEPDPDASLGDVDEAVAHNKTLQERIDALWVELAGSKKEFRVAGRTTEETQAIEKQIKVDLKEELDAAAKTGREEGKQLAARLQATTPDEINRFVRQGAQDAMNKIINLEVAARSIAESTTVKVGDAWHPITAEQVKNLYKVLGEPQVDLLARAASRTAHEAPEVTVPKS